MGEEGKKKCMAFKKRMGESMYCDENPKDERCQKDFDKPDPEVREKMMAMCKSEEHMKEMGEELKGRCRQFMAHLNMVKKKYEMYQKKKCEDPEDKECRMEMTKEEMMK